MMPKKKILAPQVTVAKKKIMATKRIAKDSDEATSQLSTKNRKVLANKKVLYVEIDDEVTTIYDRLKNLKMKNIYLVVPKRAMLFQSIVNLKILKRKVEELEKNIYIITNDANGLHLAKKIDLPVYDKLEGHEHPSLVSGKFKDDHQDITPLKASINTLEEEKPMRRTEKKFSISELIQRSKIKFSFFPKANSPRTRIKVHSEKKKEDKGKLVLVAPNRQALISLIIVSLIILLTITYIALPGATIILTPKSNVLRTSVNIVLADIENNRAELDTNPLHEIPSYKITKKIQKVLTYSATGKDFKGQNAKGTLTVINTSDQDWPLKATTRFQTSDGLVFRTPLAVTVPATKAGKPGTLEVSVVADEYDAYKQPIGEKGNIAPTKFFLPGLSAENQKKLFAESKVAFSGGKTAVTKFITKEDLEGARAKMLADLQASTQAELEALVKERNTTQKTNLALLTGANTLKNSEPKIIIPPNLEGQKLDQFEVQGEMVSVGTAYSMDELLSILKTELKLKKSPEKRLVDIDDKSLTYRIIPNDDDASKIKITATIEGIEEYEISPDKENGERLIKKIKDHIVNKDIQEAETYIQNLPQIDKVTIESWPAWAPTIPGIPDNITIELRRGEV